MYLINKEIWYSCEVQPLCSRPNSNFDVQNKQEHFSFFLSIILTFTMFLAAFGWLPGF